MASLSQNNLAFKQVADILASAQASLQSDNLPEAHRLLQEAHERQPENLEILLLLGWTAADKKAAQGYFRRVLELQPGHPLALDALSGDGSRQAALSTSSAWFEELLRLSQPELGPPQPSIGQTAPTEANILPAAQQPASTPALDETLVEEDEFKKLLEAAISEEAEALGEEQADMLLETTGFAGLEGAADFEPETYQPETGALQKIPAWMKASLEEDIQPTPPLQPELSPVSEIQSRAEPEKVPWRMWLRHRRDHLFALGYLIMVAVAEALTITAVPQVGMALHGLVMIAMLLQATIAERGSLRQGFYISLALAPLIRLLSLSLPLPSFPFVYWYAIVGAPLLLACAITARVIGVDARMMGITVRHPLTQGLVASSGIALGYLEYMILHPKPLAGGLTLEQIWLPAMILMIFTGLLEEILFRGLLQYTSLRSLGKIGLVYVALVFAVLHLGYRSAPDVIFVFTVALYFGYVVVRTGSILGVTLAHGLTNIGLFLVFPFLIK